MGVPEEVFVDEVTYFHPVSIGDAVYAHRAASAFNEGQTGISALVHTLTVPETEEFLEYMGCVEEPDFDEVLGCYVAPIPAETFSRIEAGINTGEFVIQQLIFKSDGESAPRRPIDDVRAEFNAEIGGVWARTAIANASGANSSRRLTGVQVEGADGQLEEVEATILDASSAVFTGVERAPHRVRRALNRHVSAVKASAYGSEDQQGQGVTSVSPLATCYKNSKTA